MVIRRGCKRKSVWCGCVRVVPLSSINAMICSSQKKKIINAIVGSFSSVPLMLETFCPVSSVVLLYVVEINGEPRELYLINKLDMVHVSCLRGPFSRSHIFTG